jgi:hypothetical protein
MSLEADEIIALLECYAPQSGNALPKFQNNLKLTAYNLSLQSSRVQKSKKEYPRKAQNSRILIIPRRISCTRCNRNRKIPLSSSSYGTAAQRGPWPPHALGF